MDALLVIGLVFSFYTSVVAGSGSHSIWCLATYIVGESPFPEFTVVVMLDDIQVDYYDSNDNQDKAEQGLQSMYHKMKARSLEFKRYFNSTEGTHVQQRIAGCEVKATGEPSLIQFIATFEGIVSDGMSFNMSHFSYHTGETQLPLGELDTMFLKVRLEHIYLPFCIKKLKFYLKREKSIVLRKVRPRVRLLQKPVSGGVMVSCLAFGFYPRHINLTLLRDGEPIADQELTGGEVLPNGDGTYQVRKTLEVSTEELREKHNYTCTASHRSLDNKLDVSWVPELGGVKEGPISFLVPLGIVAICCVISLLCVYICIKRKHSTASSKTSPQLSVTENESEQSSLCLKECTN